MLAFKAHPPPLLPQPHFSNTKNMRIFFLPQGSLIFVFAHICSKKPVIYSEIHNHFSLRIIFCWVVLDAKHLYNRPLPLLPRSVRHILFYSVRSCLLTSYVSHKRSLVGNSKPGSIYQCVRNSFPAAMVLPQGDATHLKKLIETTEPPISLLRYQQISPPRCSDNVEEEPAGQDEKGKYVDIGWW